jgi:hypothetical protein
MGIGRTGRTKKREKVVFVVSDKKGHNGVIGRDNPTKGNNGNI